MTSPTAAAFERSIVRSRLRLRALVMLSSLTEAFPRQLARAVGVDSSRLRLLLHGNDIDYARSLSLIGLGLAEERVTPHGRVYAITTGGRRKARQISAREIRRARMREAARDGPGRRVRVHPSERLDAGAGAPVEVAAPVETWSWRWTIEG